MKPEGFCRTRFYLNVFTMFASLVKQKITMCILRMPSFTCKDYHNIEVKKRKLPLTANLI